MGDGVGFGAMVRVSRGLAFGGSVLVAVGLVTALVLWGGVGLADLRGAFGRLSWGTWGLALGIHVGIYWMRSMRFRVLLRPGERPGGLAVFAASAAHNLAAYVLPAKTGEASLIVYLKLQGRASGTGALASLVISRLLDLASLGAAMSLACMALVFGGSELAAPGWLGGLGVGMGAVTAGFLILACRGDWLCGVAGWLGGRLGLSRIGRGRKLLDRVEGLGLVLREVGGASQMLPAMVLSAGVWLGVFLFYGVLARGFGLPESVGLAEAAFGSSLAVVTNLLPINALAGFGTQEAGWAFGFGLLGIDRDLALSTGFGVHLVQLADVVLLGFLGHLLLGAFARRGEDPGEATTGAGTES